ncbi:FecR family protein [Sphingobium estronivorans]|uniref:FecR family protein n=1 Tax=Sphingobium estronivorans TaxID=1577690 RepID=UPI001238C5B0|nr:FecR domain-containing protein [Sphingobium estronivorans]
MAEGEMPEPMPRMDQQMREASLWFARMRGPDADEWRPQFEDWLALGASHRGAYNRAGEIFALGRFMAAQHEEQAVEANDNDESGHRWRWTAIAASLLLTVGVGGWIAKMELTGTRSVPVQVAQPRMDQRAERQRYATLNGSKRTVRLADGSSVELAANSELYTNFTSDQRELKLERGRARFEVAHEARSFVVLAGGGSVTARGTIFEVSLERDERVTVRLLRGAVDVERPSTIKGTTGPAAIARLEPGEILSFAIVTPALLHPPATKGELQPLEPPANIVPVREYERTPLAAVIAEANRDSATTIHLGDPSIGALRVSGRFRVNDADQVADRLASLFDLDVEKTKPGEITLKRR